MLKMADILVEMKQYEKASTIYIKVVRITEANGLSKWSINDNLCKYLLCTLASGTFTPSQLGNVFFVLLVLISFNRRMYSRIFHV